MKEKFFVAGCVFFIFVFIGCASMKPASIIDPDKTLSAKTAYIVDTKASSAEMELAVQKAIANIGISTWSGPLDDKPKHMDVYVKCSDNWRWDMVMYLSSLNITVYDNSSNRMIASGGFDNTGFFHDYPSADQKAKEVVKSIFQRN